MKKFMMLAAVCCFIFASCNQKPAETTEPTADQTCKKDTTKCCKVSEEQKACCAAWADFANQTPEKKAELVKGAIEKINAKRAEKAAYEAKKAEVEAKWATIDKLDVDAQKALIDDMMSLCKSCKKNDGCCKKADGCQKEQKEGCCKDKK
jgi:hypothetical protein